MVTSPLADGISVIKSYVKTLPAKPGVYRMLNQRQQVLYVGKALSLKNRVANYTIESNLTTRLKRMVADTKTMEFVICKSEVEALLLEANLIKHYDPPFNVRLKDDKFFAYIHLSQHPYPRLSKYRGSKTEKGKFFGPYVSAGAIDQSLTTLYRVFKIRSCRDTYFNARTRPCLQYHIKRCSAPCMKYISPEDYKKSMRSVERFLKGETQRVQEDLLQEMFDASTAQNYERAASLRDQLKSLRSLQSQQTINLPGVMDADVFALARQGGYACIQGFFYRNGSNHGTHSFQLQEATQETPDSKLMQDFLLQFYADKTPPKQILLQDILQNKDQIQEALSQKRGKSLYLEIPLRGEKATILKSVFENALESLERMLQSKRAEKSYLEALADTLDLPFDINRIEVYDNSHIQGTNAIGAMIVAGRDGFDKRAYRKFLIKSKDLVPGDDFGMMREVLERRFAGSLAKSNLNSNVLPDLVIIDGGKGQLHAAQDVLEALDLDIPLLAIAKGPDRNAGRETFFTLKHPEGFKLENQKFLLFYLQRLRDEAHRSAITFHRSKRTKTMGSSSLDQIPDVGPKRKRALLHHFGSAPAIKAASQEDLEKVQGISKNLAKHIYRFLHSR